MRFDSLKARFQIALLTLAIVPLLSVGLALAIRTYNTQVNQVVELQGEIARRIASEVESFAFARISELDVAAQVSGIQTGGIDVQRSFLNEMLSYQSAFDALALLDNTGQEVARVSRLTLITEADFINRSNAPEFALPFTTGEVFVGSAQVDSATAQITSTISIPLVEPRSGDISYILVAEVRLSFLSNLLSNVQDSTTTYVLNSEGRVIAHANSSLVLRETYFNLPTEAGIHPGLSGEDSVMAFTSLPISNDEIFIVSEQPVTVALSLVRTTAIVLGLAIAANLVLALLLATLGTRFIVQPLQELALVAQKIEQGDFSQRAVVKGSDEIGVLGQSFNSMTEQLSQLIENLEERVADRTRDLTIAADVSTQVSSILDLNTLLPQVVDEMRSAYDYYHVSVFLLDETSKTLNLAAAAGRNNRKLDNMQFKLDGQGIVPKAARTRQPVFINDVRNEPSYYANPALPDTRMEGSIPMIVGNRVIGVLDIQLDWMEDFAADRLGIAVSLATQIGIAVQNAQSYTEAQAARQQAMDANKIKSMFLANMSHELRTPLNAILNFTAFVADGTLGEVNAEQVETLEEAIASGRHLLSLINDVLDITKIEAGLMDLFIQDVDMNEIVSSVAAVGKGLVKDKSIILNTEIEPNLPITYGDKRRLRQVFLNMLSNAVKFTPAGQVTIRAKAIANGVRVEVQDTGIGIAPEDQSLVFESFKQAKHELQEAVGTGLGMPISRYFVESHGGKMWLTSELGKGSTFYVELPVLTEEQANAINMSMTEQVA